MATFINQEDRDRLDEHDKKLADMYGGKLTYDDGRKTPLWYSLYSPEGKTAFANRFMAKVSQRTKAKRE